MSRCLWVAMLLCIVLTASCGKPPAPVSVPVAQVREPGAPYDWVNDPPVTSTVTFAEMDVTPDALRDAILRWKAAAQRMRATDWFHRPWYKRPHGEDFVTWWSTLPEHVAPVGYLEVGPYVDPDTTQHVCVTYQSTPGYEGARLDASYSSKESWSAFLDVRMERAGWKYLSISFQPPGVLFNYADRGIWLYPDYFTWWQDFKFGEIDYTIAAAVSPASVVVTQPPIDPNANAVLPAGLLAHWTSSSEDFKQNTLETLNKLESNLRADLASAAAVRSAILWQMKGGTHGGDPPRPNPQPSDRPLSGEEKQTILEAGLKEISRRRAEITKHSVELHAALLKVFPLSEVIGPAAK